MKLIKPAIIGTLTTALAVFALGGFAGGTEGSQAIEGSQAMQKPAFEELDANVDGAITAAEAKESWLATAFQSVDVNKDGVVDRKEYDKAKS